MYYWIYFNPRSREGSDFGKIMKYLSEVDFNPRSREGSDCSSRALIYILHNFNPRSREGSDKIIDKPLPIHPISIHAPARGATKTGCTVCGKQIFQSTLPRGERPGLTLYGKSTQIFQSTLPRGERPHLIAFDLTKVLFQSTLPRGERLHLLTFFRLQYGYILFHLTNKYSFCF